MSKAKTLASIVADGGPLADGQITTADISGTLPIANGGTGLTSLGTAGQALVVNSGATALEYGSAGISTNKAIAMAFIFNQG